MWCNLSGKRGNRGAGMSTSCYSEKKWGPIIAFLFVSWTSLHIHSIFSFIISKNFVEMTDGLHLECYCCEALWDILAPRFHGHTNTCHCICCSYPAATLGRNKFCICRLGRDNHTFLTQWEEMRSRGPIIAFLFVSWTSLHICSILSFISSRKTWW